MDDDGCESLPTCFFEFVHAVVQTIFRVGLTQVLKASPFKELSLGLLETHTELLIRFGVRVRNLELTISDGRVLVLSAELRNSLQLNCCLNSEAEGRFLSNPSVSSAFVRHCSRLTETTATDVRFLDKSASTIAMQ